MQKKIVKGSELVEKMGLKSQLAVKPMRSLGVSLPHEGGVIRKEEMVAQSKVEIILAEAQKEADRIKAEAEKLLSQVQTEMEKAKKEGYHAGKEEGLAEWTEEILKAKKLKEDFYASAEPEVIKLVMSIAEKVIGKLVQDHKEIVCSIVHQALEHSLGDKIVIKMNPEDLKRLEKEDLEFRDLMDRTKQVHFKEDEAIERGGCVVETEVGTIDAQLETQLKAIRKALGV
ncbi:MAG: hypothetical protein HY877_05820 [Deltaproteobacteria bacterium]|nr:hypothetical protein [Deltaproteobacteria bacterium]